MAFIKCNDFHKMCCVAWKQEYTYIHAYAGFQTQMYLAGLYLPSSWTVTETIKFGSECVLISTTVKFLLKKKTEYTPCTQHDKMAHGNVLKMVATSSKAGVVLMPYPNTFIKSSCMTDGFNAFYICIYSLS